MSRLILIKHSHSEMTPGVRPDEWELSEQGRGRCALLARVLTERELVPEVFVASEERKAAETARLVAGAVGKSWEIGAGLQEQDRNNVPVMQTRDFISSMALVFKRKDELVLGRETARQAKDRFERAVRRIVKAHEGSDVGVVTHGTVIALFAEEHAKVDAFANWRQMGLPSFMVFDVEGMKLVETVASVL